MVPLANLISSLVNRYGHWDNVPQELKDQLSGYFEEGVGWVDGPSGQALQIDALMQAMYEKIHSGDLALAGTPDYAGGIGGDHFNDPYNLLPVEARRPAYHGEWIGTASENWLHERFGSEGGGGGSWEQSHDTNFNPSSVPKVRLDDLVAEGLAQRFVYESINPGGLSTTVVTEVIVVDTPMGKMVFKRNQRPSDIYNSPDVLTDSYALIDKVPSTYSTDTIGNHYTADAFAARRQEATLATLTFALHLVPLGAAADYGSQGDTGEALLSVAGDVAMVLVPASKLSHLAKFGRSTKGMRAGAIALEGGIGLYRAGQAIDILQREDGTYAEAAGPAGEAMLRLLGISGPVAKELAKLGDYRIEIDPAVLNGSKYYSNPLTGGLRVVRKSKQEIEFDSLARLAGDERYKGRNIREYDGRYGPGTEIDWIDDWGRTYDQIGNPNTVPHWTEQRANFYSTIHEHLRKVDFTVIDLTDWPDSIKNEITDYLFTLPQADFDKLIIIGF